MDKINYTPTIRASFVGYVVQAIVNNFLPLLFLTLQTELELSLPQITSLVTINFCVQLTVDLLAAKYVDRIGYRPAVVAAHVLAAAGLVSLTILPYCLPSAYLGLLISVVLYAAGGGLLEVVISPIVEACPTEHKEKTMSLLHSFYCWGQVAVVLFSTVFFAVWETSHWRFLAIIWALVPACNAVAFLRVPIVHLLDEKEEAVPVSEMFRSRLFWIFLFLMFCAGACELSVSQWASAFAEHGLGVSKSVGDLAGPMFFAVLMGLARLLYGKYGEKIDLVKFMLCSGVLCTAAYLLTALSPLPVLGLIGCGICGFSVGILWPGTYSIAAASMRRGGTAMFALMALAGDLGCSGGPTLVGMITELADGSFNIGILAGAAFPLLLLIGLGLFLAERRRS